MTSPLPRRLRSRLALKQTVSFALLVIVLAWSAYGFLSRRIYDQLDAELQDRGIAVRSMLQVRSNEVRWINKAADPEVREQFERSIRFYELLDDHGRALESSQEMSGLRLPWTETASETLTTGRTGWETFKLPTGTNLRILDSPVVGFQQRRYVMRIGTLMSDAEEDVSRIRLIMLALVPLILLGQALNSWLIAGRELRAIEQLTVAARQINALDLSARFPVSGTGDELDQLSTALNGTLTKLQVSFQRMSEFLRNLSHEIRQPLTVMRAEAEQALRVRGGDEAYREMLSKQLEHVELLARTVSDLMELAQSDTEEIKLNCQTEDLSEMVQAAIDGMRLKSTELSIQISGTVQQNVIGQFDPGQMWRLILNLLDNAIKYNHPDGRVDVVLSSHQDSAILTVTDTGHGISAEEQQRIFERGYRAASIRKSVSGTGLGLHFARSIARAHGGDIEVSSSPGRGSSFRVTLPLITVADSPVNKSHEKSVQ